MRGRFFFRVLAFEKPKVKGTFGDSFLRCRVRGGGGESKSAQEEGVYGSGDYFYLKSVPNITWFYLILQHTSQLRTIIGKSTQLIRPNHHWSFS